MTIKLETRTLIEKTPAAVAKFLYLNEPYRPKDMKDGDKAKWRAVVVFDPKDEKWAELCKSIKAEVKQIIADHNCDNDPNQLVGCPFAREVDAEEKPTGMYLFKTASGFQPAVYDSNGRRIRDVSNIGNGSVVGLAFKRNLYTRKQQDLSGKNNIVGGINLYLSQIQIVEMVEYGQCAFDVVEGGYVSQPPEEKAEGDDTFGTHSSDSFEEGQRTPPMDVLDEPNTDEDDLPF